MGYIVVKDFNKQGCICFGTDNKGLYCSLPTMLEDAVDTKRVQVICLSNPSMYGEYEPYRFIDDLGDFVKEDLSI